MRTPAAVNDLPSGGLKPSSFNCCAIGGAFYPCFLSSTMRWRVCDQVLNCSKRATGRRNRVYVCSAPAQSTQASTYSLCPSTLRAIGLRQFDGSAVGSRFRRSVQHRKPAN